MTQSGRKNLLNRFVQFIYYILVLLLLSITFYGIYALRIPLSIAILLYFILNPMVDFLEGMGIGRELASAVALLLIGGALALVIINATPFLVSESRDILAQSGIYKEKISEMITAVYGTLKSNLPSSILPLDTVSPEEITNYLFSLSDRLMPHTDFTETLSVVQEYVMAALFDLVITLLALFFLLLQGDEIYKRLMEMVPNRYFEMTLLLTHTIRKKINAYLVAIVAQMSIISTLFIVGLSLIGIPYAPVLGIFAGVINVIPYLGPMLGAVPILLFAVVMGGFSTTFFLALGLVALAHLVDNVYNQPVLLARAVNLNPMLALIALGTFETLFGIGGMLIAIPFTGILLVILPVARRNLRAFGII